MVFVDGLTKYLYVHPCSFGNADRPMSATARDGLKEFIRRSRLASNSPQLHPMHLKTDRGSEFAAGAFRTWMTAQNNQRPEVNFEQERNATVLLCLFYEIRKNRKRLPSLPSLAKQTHGCLAKDFHFKYNFKANYISDRQVRLNDILNQHILRQTCQSEARFNLF